MGDNSFPKNNQSAIIHMNAGWLVFFLVSDYGTVLGPLLGADGPLVSKLVKSGNQDVFVEQTGD